MYVSVLVSSPIIAIGASIDVFMVVVIVIVVVVVVVVVLIALNEQAVVVKGLIR